MEQKISDELRAIVIKFTRIGGYPDTFSMVSEAYALGLEAGKASTPHMKMERSIWCGATHNKEEQSMAEWVETASHEDLEKLLKNDFATTNKSDQAFLARIWNECANCAGNSNTFASDCDQESLTYYWFNDDRIAFQKMVKELLPKYFEPDPGQKSLFD